MNYPYRKESFSADGRVLCSPYGNRTRILAFGEDCHEPVPCQGQRQELKEMTEVCVTEEHEDLVLAAKFSPQQLLATGGCRGEVKFHQPVL